MPRNKEDAPQIEANVLKYNVLHDSCAPLVVDAFAALGVAIEIKPPVQHEQGPDLGNPFGHILVDPQFKDPFKAVCGQLVKARRSAPRDVFDIASAAQEAVQAVRAMTKPKP